MSIYFVKGKGWRYDFTLNETRYTNAWYKTKTEAKQAKAQRREEITRPKPDPETEKTPTDIVFLDLANKRLDYIRAYNSENYYSESLYHARRWVKQWGPLNCGEISTDMIESYLLERSKKPSACTANKELRYLRALFNFAMRRKRGWISENPTEGIEFLPVEKRTKYVPAKQDILAVILAANPDTQDYLWTISLTVGRVGEINRLIWQDVNFQERYVVLYTRKKRGGAPHPKEGSDA